MVKTYLLYWNELMVLWANDKIVTRNDTTECYLIILRAEAVQIA